MIQVFSSSSLSEGPYYCGFIDVLKLPSSWFRCYFQPGLRSAADICTFHVPLGIGGREGSWPASGSLFRSYSWRYGFYVCWDGV